MSLRIKRELSIKAFNEQLLWIKKVWTNKKQTHSTYLNFLTFLALSRYGSIGSVMIVLLMLLTIPRWTVSVHYQAACSATWRQPHRSLSRSLRNFSYSSLVQLRTRKMIWIFYLTWPSSTFIMTYLLVVEMTVSFQSSIGVFLGLPII